MVTNANRQVQHAFSTDDRFPQLIFVIRRPRAIVAHHILDESKIEPL
jgi:hypothetical protein